MKTKVTGSGWIRGEDTLSLDKAASRDEAVTPSSLTRWICCLFPVSGP